MKKNKYSLILAVFTFFLLNFSQNENSVAQTITTASDGQCIVKGHKEFSTQIMWFLIVCDNTGSFHCVIPCKTEITEN